MTGGAGFIGANFVQYWLEAHPSDRVVVLDALTYAGNRTSLQAAEGRNGFRFVHGDICDREQVAVPTRTHIDAYDRLNEKIEEMAAAINERYGTRSWTPIQLVQESLPAERLALLYRMADVCIVSSLQDGMNLVAKEYVASQVDDTGVLLLSKFAGAIEELAGCLPMNPYDPENAADLIRIALEMRAADRRARMQQLRT